MKYQVILSNFALKFLLLVEQHQYLIVLDCIRLRCNEKWRAVYIRTSIFIAQFFMFLGNSVSKMPGLSANGRMNNPSSSQCAQHGSSQKNHSCAVLHPGLVGPGQISRYSLASKVLKDLYCVKTDIEIKAMEAPLYSQTIDASLSFSESSKFKAVH